MADLARQRSLAEFHFVFDLDSTVFDVTPRTQAIFDDFCKLRTDLKLPKLKFEHADWGIRQAFDRAGIPLTDATFKNFHEFWRQKFFSSDYLDRDIPYPSAIEYIRLLYNRGIEISYLTGRDAENMQLGTENCLRHFGLPLQTNSENLKMKPQKAWGEDEDFKARELRQMLKASGKPIVFFENEPVIIQLVHKELPEVLIVYTDTVHSGRSQVSADVYQLQSWKKELEQLRLLEG